MKQFSEKYKISQSGCWLWAMSKDKDGYGLSWLNGAFRRAHRVSWQLNRGPIPTGLMVLHKCDIPSCVNPKHLFLGNQKENIADALRKKRAPQLAKRTHCKRGHLLSADNLFIHTNGERQCRKCHNDGQRRRYHERQALL